MKLFESWTFSLPLPEPVKGLAEVEGARVSTEAVRCSVHNDRREARRSTLHGPTLRALECLRRSMEEGEGALGIQADTGGTVRYYFLEYGGEGDRTGIVYNPSNGEMSWTVRPGEEEKEPERVGPGEGDGRQFLLMLAFASLIPEGELYDGELESRFLDYCRHREDAGEQFLADAYVCCDNLYRRAVGLKLPLGRGIREEGKADRLAEGDLEIYQPTQTHAGTFLIFKTGGEEDRKDGPVTVGEILGKYRMELELTEEEKSRIPDIPDHYLVPADAENILRKITVAGMRVFMLRGEAGTGKTTTVQIIAKCLGMPYYYFCCGEGTEEADLVSSYLPNTAGPKGVGQMDADWMEFMMDPSAVLERMAGECEEGLSMQEAFSRLLAEAFRRGQEEAESRRDFVLVESDLVRGCRRPSLVEIQEPTVIGRAGTLVKLNSLLDGCAAVTLPSGEVVRRHPDTVIILTTNTAYNGCRPMNQSVLSRLNLIIDGNSLTAEEMAARAAARTGCREEEMLLKMAEILLDLKKNFSDLVAMGGICGYREYEDWVIAWMESGELEGELKDAVISKMTDQQEAQQEILDYVKTIAAAEQLEREE